MMELIYPVVEPHDAIMPMGETIMIQHVERPIRAHNISDNIHPSWHRLFFSSGFSFSAKLRAIFIKAYQNNLMVRPSPKDVLNVFQMPVPSIRIVIVGQDPYPGWDVEAKNPIANGWAFATNSKSIPGSLSRIVDSIQERLGSVEITNKNAPFSLQGWIEQGVFLLNNTPIVYVPRDKNLQIDAEMKATLTFPTACWKGLTLQICKYISAVNNGVRFILVGSATHYLHGNLSGCVMTSHPSTRSSKDFTGDCFEKIPEINWRRI
jgi:uracil DNA glycosylase